MRRSVWSQARLYALSLFLVFVFLLPMLWTLSTSLKEPRDIQVYPPSVIPSPPTFRNYTELWQTDDGIFRRFFMNSVIVSVGTMLLVAAASTLAGYGFAILKFHGKEIIFVIMISALLIPFQALLIPLFELIKNFKMLNTYRALILIYATFHLPFGVFMMRNAFSAVPTAVRESAQLDGANELRVLWHVMLPLVLPGLVTVAVYSFYTAWNEFLVALVFTTEEQMKTLTLGLQQFTITRYSTRWETLSAGAIVSFIPVMLLFAFLQRYFIRGVTGGAIKG